MGHGILQNNRSRKKRKQTESKKRDGEISSSFEISIAIVTSKERRQKKKKEEKAPSLPYFLTNTHFHFWLDVLSLFSRLFSPTGGERAARARAVIFIVFSFP